MNQKLEEYNFLSIILFVILNIRDKQGVSLPGNNNILPSSPIFSIRHLFVTANADTFYISK